jgi:hypothetical protein
VPARFGRIAKLNLITEQLCTIVGVYSAFLRLAAKWTIKGVMSVLEEALPSARVIADSHSCTVELALTSPTG